jgi:hypothetical protein
MITAIHLEDSMSIHALPEDEDDPIALLARSGA